MSTRKPKKRWYDVESIVCVGSALVYAESKEDALKQAEDPNFTEWDSHSARIKDGEWKARLLSKEERDDRELPEHPTQ